MKKIIFILVTLLLSLSTVWAQDTEFWFAPNLKLTSNLHEGNGGFLFTNTTDRPAVVTIEYFRAGIASETFTIPPHEGYHKRYSNSETLDSLEIPIADIGKVTQGGVHITSTEKVTVYYFSDVEYIKDIFTLKGATAMGTKFLVTQQADGHFENQYSYLKDHVAIMATEENTKVTFTVPRDCYKGGANGGTGSGSVIDTYYKDIEYTETLNRGDVLYLMETVTGPSGPGNNLNRAEISSDKPIVVTSAESCVGMDEVGDQLVPIDHAATIYAVVKGYSFGSWTGSTSTMQDRIYITSTEDGNTGTIEDGSTTIPFGPLNKGDSYTYEMGNKNSNPYAVVIKTEKPSLCFHVTAKGGHPAGALVPSLYSIGQNKFSFYVLKNDDNNDNAVMLIYRDTCHKSFVLTYESAPGVEVKDTLFDASGNLHAGYTLDTQDTPLPGQDAGGWNFMRLHLPLQTQEKLVTISNYSSNFSLGYFSGDAKDGYYCVYGYLSSFSRFKFDPDTIWRCDPNLPITLMGGFASNYKWTYPDDTSVSGDDKVNITTTQPGKYILEMNQGVRQINSIWILDVVFDASIEKIPRLPKPAKVDVPQRFSITMSDALKDQTTINWTFDGGIPATGTGIPQFVTWKGTGKRRVTAHLRTELGSGESAVFCDTLLVLDVDVRPKHIGYFVDKHVSGGEENGTDWTNAFRTVQEALEYASQGDYIWVAKGDYSPPEGTSYTIDYDSVAIYGGFNATEKNLDERDPALNPTILRGNRAPVVRFDGSTEYLNIPPLKGVSQAARLDGFIVEGGTGVSGSGITFDHGASGTLSHLVIRDNEAKSHGGGIAINGAYGGVGATSSHRDPLLYNVEISGNRAPQGGAIYNNSDAKLVNVTISGNGSAGLYNVGGDPILQNTILWGNLSNTKEPLDVVVSGGTPSYSYSDVGGSGGSKQWNPSFGMDRGKNLDLNPLFSRKGYDEENNFVRGYYRLISSSKLVNYGYNRHVNDLFAPRSIVLLRPNGVKNIEGILRDLAGNDRINDDRVDVGAYEYHTSDQDPNLVHKVLIPSFENLSTIPPAGKYPVNAHYDDSITFIPKEGYSLKYMVVTTGSTQQDLYGGAVRKDHADGRVTMVFREVSEPLNIWIEGVTPTSNEVLVSEPIVIRAVGGRLYLKTNEVAELSVYTLTGARYHYEILPAGEKQLDLPRGSYVVTLGGKKVKVVL